jgi:polyribonucleotide nucleotidyltransferase
VPLIAYGIISIMSLQRGTRQGDAGDQNIATRAAEEIRRYVTTNAELLKALAANLKTQVSQRGTVSSELRPGNSEFREISLFAEDGRVLARAHRHAAFTSRKTHRSSSTTWRCRAASMKICSRAPCS